MKNTAEQLSGFVTSSLVSIFFVIYILNIFSFAADISETYNIESDSQMLNQNDRTNDSSIAERIEQITPPDDESQSSTTTSSLPKTGNDSDENTSLDTQNETSDQQTTFPDTKLEPTPDPDNEEITILCLGDSVTFGTPYGGTSSTYPAKLDSKLEAAFSNYDFNTLNKGVGGWRADQVLGSTNGWLSTYNPDIVLLMVGGNDLKQETVPETPEKFLQVVDQTVTEVQGIINTVKTHKNPDNTTPKMIVSAFIPNNYEGVLGSAGVSYYNLQMQSDLSGYDSYFTTNWSSFYDSKTGQAKTSLMTDSFHPNASGYSIMATNFYNQVVSFI